MAQKHQIAIEFPTAYSLQNDPLQSRNELLA